MFQSVLLIAALECCHSLFPRPHPGPGSHSQVLFHLPPAGKELLLATGNSVVITWGKAVVILILKRRNRSLATSYWPFSHPNYVCKIIECIVNQ
jgi:hypothetical protein